MKSTCTGRSLTGSSCKLARNDAGLLAADVQHEQGGEEGAGLDMALQGAAVDGDVLGRPLPP